MIKKNNILSCSTVQSLLVSLSHSLVSSSVHLTLSLSPFLSPSLTGHDHRPSKSSFKAQVQLLSHADRSPRLVIRHTCITGTSSRQASALALIHRQHPLALLIIRGLGIRAGRQVILNFFLSFFLSTVLLDFWGCARTSVSRTYRRQTGTRADSSHPIIVIASERSRTSINSHPHHPILSSFYCV